MKSYKVLSAPSDANKKFKLASPYEQLKQYITNQSTEYFDQVNIIIDDLDQQFKLSEIPIYLINDWCISMNIQLKGFYTDQNDFEAFCDNFKKFPYLESLQLKFYNRRIQYLDCLFQSIANIKRVSISLQNFRKIRFESSLKELYSYTEDLSIDMQNTTFKTKEDKNVFETYLVGLKNLTHFRFSFKNVDQLKLLLVLPKETQIYLKLNSQDIGLPFCDQLISLIEEYDLNVIEIQSTFNMLNAYLSQNGLKVVKPYISSMKLLTFKVGHFTKYDVSLIEKTPSLFDPIINNIVKTDYLRIDGFYKMGHSVKSKLNLQVIDKLIIPMFRLVSTISFEGIYNMRMVNCIWQIGEYSFINKDPFFERIFPHLTMIKFTTSTYNLDKQIILAVMKKISTSIHLVLFDIGFNDDNILRYSQSKQYLFSLLINHSKMIQTQCIDRLRYFVFQKYFFGNIPIPQQIFYDLLDQ